MFAASTGLRWRCAYAIAWAALAWERAWADARAPVSWAPGGRALLAPTAMGFGVAAYLGLAEEPLAAIGVLWLAAGLWLWRSARRLELASTLTGLAALAAWAGFGFVWADGRTAAVATPMVAETGEPQRLTGWVERIDASETTGRRRYVVRVATLEGATPDETPYRVRVSAPAGAARLGEGVGVQAVLYPPPTPSVPGGYDFARAAYFQKLGGVGRAVGRIEPVDVAGMGAPIARGVARARGRLAERLRRFGGAEAGPVIAALVTGDRGDIPPEVSDDLRAAGLGHVLAISGLHMALIGGGAFFLFLKLLSAIDPLARRMDVRKPAALAALCAASVYLVMSGASVSAQRAYVMTAIALVAVLLDRRALSLNNVASAGVIVLILRPEAALEPGFQMSFAATAALIAAYGAARRRRLERGPDPVRRRGVFGAVRRFLVASAVTSFVAGLATAPFAAYHFNRVAHLGFAANVAAMPVFTLVVMPSAAAAGALAPVGLEGPPALVASTGLDVVLAVARTVSEREGALAPSAAAPPIALALLVTGLVGWCARARGRWRLAAPLWAAALVAWTAAPRGQLWIGEEGSVAAHIAGRAGAETVGRDGYGAELFLRRAGALVEGRPPPLENALQCDEASCVARINGRQLAVTRRLAALDDDCARADVVVFLGSVPSRAAAACASTRLLEAHRFGATPRIVDLSQRRVLVRSVSALERPWRERA